MPSLERFFNPQTRPFDLNIRSLPGAKLYFFEAGSSTPKTTFSDKQGENPHTNPVVADPNGIFPQIFLDGLYRAELRSSSEIVQPGWPIDNIGQDNLIVPFGPWIEIVVYNTGEVVTGSNGNWYRSISDNNLGNDPISSPAQWEVIPIPVASSFTSNKAYVTFSDDGDQVSVDIDADAMADDVEDYITDLPNNITIGGSLVANSGATFTGGVSVLGGNLYVAGTISSKDRGVARRNATLTITSDITLNKDPQLSIINLETGFYQVSGIIIFNTNSGGAGNGLKITLDGDTTTTLQNVVWQRFSSTAAIDALVTSVPVFESAGASDNYILFNGTIRFDSAVVGDGIAVWVSQNVSSATPVEIKSGSSLVVQRIGDGI